MEAGIRELKVGMGKRGMEDGEDQEVKLEAGMERGAGDGGLFPPLWISAPAEGTAGGAAAAPHAQVAPQPQK